MTSMLEQAILVAKEDQDALAAEILKWIDDNRRWADLFARTHEALRELARAEHQTRQTLDAAYAEMASTKSREGEAAEWSPGLMAEADG